MGFSHSTAFNYRHKILSALETLETIAPTVLSGVCELDDTYVLESSKGKKTAGRLLAQRLPWGQHEVPQPLQRAVFESL